MNSHMVEISCSRWFPLSLLLPQFPREDSTFLDQSLGFCEGATGYKRGSRLGGWREGKCWEAGGKDVTGAVTHGCRGGQEDEMGKNRVLRCWSSASCWLPGRKSNGRNCISELWLLRSTFEDTAWSHSERTLMVLIDAWPWGGVPHVWAFFSMPFPLRWKGNTGGLSQARR